MEGTPFGRYRLVELLGRGGMGEVWRAFDTVTERVVALKMLPPQFSDDATFQQRFRREALAAARLNSPHVIPIYDYGEIDGRLYVSMRLVEGRDLHAVLTDGPVQPDRAVRIIEQIAKALHAAHKVGLVHRDVKPSNILLDEDEFAYLIDFGIARAADDTRMTGTGNAIGTFQYMAPERLADSPDDARADIYALACVLYECLTGQPPFAGSNMASLVAAHLHTPPPQPSTTHPNVPEQVDEVIATGMAKDPDRRYSTTVELSNAARDAITTPHFTPVPIPPEPTPPPRVPKTEPVGVTPVADQRPPPPSAVDNTATTRHRPPINPVHPMPHPSAPVATASLRQQPAERSSSERPWWRRTPVLIFAVALIAVIGVVATVLFNRNIDSKTVTYGPQVAVPFPDDYLRSPSSVAVDVSGTVYVTDTMLEAGSTLTPRVSRLTPGSTAPEVLPFAAHRTEQPAADRGSVTVDSAGTVYVAEGRGGGVFRLTAGSTVPERLPFTGIQDAAGVAVDSKGGVYVAGGDDGRVYKLAAGTSTQNVLPFTGIQSARSVAIDGEDSVYVADLFGRVLKLKVDSTTPEAVPFTGITTAMGVAVDNARAVYVTDFDHDRVLRLAAGSRNPEVLPFAGINHPTAIALDAAGAVYVTDRKDRVLKLAQR